MFGIDKDYFKKVKGEIVERYGSPDSTYFFHGNCPLWVCVAKKKSENTYYVCWNPNLFPIDKPAHFFTYVENVGYNPCLLDCITTQIIKREEEAVLA